jgi:hypothetical protein
VKTTTPGSQAEVISVERRLIGGCGGVVKLPVIIPGNNETHVRASEASVDALHHFLM